MIRPFLMERGMEIRRVHDALAGRTDAPTLLSTHAFTSMMGGRGIVRLAPLAEGAHLGAFFECAGPVLARLNSMAQPTRAALVLSRELTLPHASGLPSGLQIVSCWQTLEGIRGTFTSEELGLVTEVAPVSNMVLRAGDDQSWDHDLTPRPDVETILPCLELAAARTQGIRHLTHDLNHMVAWRSWLNTYLAASMDDRCYILSSSGHGSVTFLTTDTPLAHEQALDIYQTTLRRTQGSPALGRNQLGPEDPCPTCALTPALANESLERHIVRCPMIGNCHSFHGKLAGQVAKIMREAGAHKADVLFEMANLRRGDATRPGDVVWRDYITTPSPVSTCWWTSREPLWAGTGA